MKAEKNINPEKEKASDIKVTLEKLHQLIAERPSKADLYCKRAELYFQMNDLGKAVNDYKKALEINPQNKEVSGKIEFITTILRYQNTDIYANPNTDMDPWLE
ncbi:MAG: tetratricopeptide repeat protein [Bacteroidales bacterium]|nr:tetratricopeptide repeat protein [Bacteroidales bacterium]